MRRFLAIFALLLALCLTLAACQPAATDPDGGSSLPETSDESSDPDAPDLPAMPLRDPIPDKVLASLEGYEASSLDFGYFFLVFQNQLEYNAYMMGYSDMEEFWNTEIEGVTLRQMLQNEALRSTKDFAVFYKLATEMGTVVEGERNQESDAQIDSMLDDFEGDEQEFLNSYGLTPQQMKDVYHKINLVNQFQTQQLNSIEIPDADTLAAYNESPEAYDEVTVRHVLVNCSDEMPQEEQDAAKAKADDILAQIQGGADIGALAAEHSDDGGSKNLNGEYTFAKDGSMVAEFEEWAFSAAEGDQGIVKTQFGYHIMQLMSRSGYEDVKALLAKPLQEEKFREIYADKYALIESEDWEIDQETVDLIINN